MTAHILNIYLYMYKNFVWNSLELFRSFRLVTCSLELIPNDSTQF